MRTSTKILSASNILLSVFNDENMPIDDKYEIFRVIEIMSIVATDCIIESKSKSYFQDKVIDVIAAYNDRSKAYE